LKGRIEQQGACGLIWEGSNAGGSIEHRLLANQDEAGVWPIEILDQEYYGRDQHPLCKSTAASAVRPAQQQAKPTTNLASSEDEDEADDEDYRERSENSVMEATLCCATRDSLPVGAIPKR
jgi:hypothetical protein